MNVAVHLTDIEKVNLLLPYLNRNLKIIFVIENISKAVNIEYENRTYPAVPVKYFQDNIPVEECDYFLTDSAAPPPFFLLQRHLSKIKLLT